MNTSIYCWVELCRGYLRGERETDRMGDLDRLRAGDPFPLRAGLTDLEGDLEADLQTKIHISPVSQLQGLATSNHSRD